MRNPCHSICRWTFHAGAGWHTSFWMMKHDGTGGTGMAATLHKLDVCENDSVNCPRRQESFIIRLGDFV